MKISDKKKNMRKSFGFKPKFTCPNCKKQDVSGHFVPPMFNEKGFFTCEK
jgi:transcription elongation factor Elf1